MIKSENIVQNKDFITTLKTSQNTNEFFKNYIEDFPIKTNIQSNYINLEELGKVMAYWNNYDYNHKCPNLSEFRIYLVENIPAYDKKSRRLHFRIQKSG